MDFDLNEEMMTSRGYSPDEKTEDDYGWWETVGLQFKKDTITATSNCVTKSFLALKEIFLSV